MNGFWRNFSGFISLEIFLKFNVVMASEIDISKDKDQEESPNWQFREVAVSSAYLVDVTIDREMPSFDPSP